MTTASEVTTVSARDVLKSEPGFDLTKADKATMRASCEALGIEVAKLATESELAAALIEYFRDQKKSKGKKLLDCTDCGGGSTKDLDDCPFCGSSGELEADAEAKPKAEKPKAEKAKAEEKKPETDPRGSVEKKDDDDGAAYVESARARGIDVDVPPGEKGGRKSTRKRADDEGDQPTTTALAKTNGASNGQTSIPVVATLERAPTEGEKKLDERVARIHKLGDEFGRTTWKVGVEIRAVFDDETWKQRMKVVGKDKAGAPKLARAFSSFDEWVSTEIGIRAPAARNLMRVSAKFDELTVGRFGAAKLGHLLRAPEEEQDRLMRETLEKNGTKADVEREVAAAREKHGGSKFGGTKPISSKSERTSAATRAAAEKKREAAKSKEKANEKITVAKILGKERVPLFTAASMKSPKGGVRKPVRAKSLKDDPVGNVLLANDVGEFFTVVSTPKGLELVIVRKRVEE